MSDPAMLRTKIETQSSFSDIFDVRRRADEDRNLRVRWLGGTAGVNELPWSGVLLVEQERRERDLAVARYRRHITTVGDDGSCLT